MKKAFNFIGLHLPVTFKSSCNPLENHYRVAPAPEKSPNKDFEAVTGIKIVQSVRKKSFSKDNTRTGLKLYPKHNYLTPDIIYTQVSYLKHLCHPHLLPLKAIYEDHLVIYFAFELQLDPVPISQVLSKIPSPKEIIPIWIKQILQALEYLHSNCAIHGRLELNSILINSKNHAILSGYEGNTFRISRSSSEPSFNNQGQPGDMLCLGLVLYFLLHDVTFCIETNGPSKPFKLPSEVSPLAENLLSQLLSPKPVTRPTPFQALQHPWFSDDTDI